MKISLTLAWLIALWSLAFPALALDIDPVISPGGIEAWLVEDDQAPVISVVVTFRGGTAWERPSKEGLTRALTWLANEGAGDLDSKAFLARLAERGIEFSANYDRDSIRFSLRFLPEDRDLAFHLLGLVLSEPRFDAEPMARMRRELLQDMRDRISDPDYRVNQAFNRLVFRGDPYANDPDGTDAGIAGITSEDLHRFRRLVFTREHLFVSVAGRITPQELAPLLDSTFGALPAASEAVKLPELPLPKKGEVVVLDADLTQSQIVFAQPGLDWHDPDYFALFLVDYILGGGEFSSRLMMEAREKRGLTYGIYTWLWDLDRADLWGGSVTTPNATAGKMLGIIRAEWRRMAESGPTPEELAKAKTYLIGSYPLYFSSTMSIAETVNAIHYGGFDRDYIDRRNAAISAVTLADAKRVAKRLLDPDRLIFVIIGRPEGVTPTMPPPQ